MKVIKKFYTHKERKKYNIGDTYNGVKFDGWKEYLQEEKKKVVKKAK